MNLMPKLELVQDRDNVFRINKDQLVGNNHDLVQVTERDTSKCFVASSCCCSGRVNSRDLMIRVESLFQHLVSSNSFLVDAPLGH